MTEKFCKDCKWHAVEGEYVPSYTCLHPRLGKHPVSGKPKCDYCSSQRQISPIAAFFNVKCGRRGNWWEPKA